MSDNTIRFMAAPTKEVMRITKDGIFVPDDVAVDEAAEGVIAALEDHIRGLVERAVAAEREKLKHELLALERWKGLALAKEGDGRTVQRVEAEAKAAEREECAKVCDDVGRRHYGAVAEICAKEVRARGQA